MKDQEEQVPEERNAQIFLYDRLFTESQQPSASREDKARIRVTLNRIKLALGYGLFTGSHERMMAEVAKLKSEQKPPAAADSAK